VRITIRQALCIATGLLVAAGAHAQSTQATDELKAQLEQALKVISDLQNRVNALEQQRAATPGTPAAPGVTVPKPAVEGAPVIGPDAVAETGARDSGKARLEISGKVMLDVIYDFDRMNPDWNSTLRPSQIPVVCPGDAGCGKNGETIFSLRQSSIDFKGFVPTAIGQLRTDLSFDLFANGGGNTNIRLLNAWAEAGKWGAGQYYSNFMNIDTFPNTIDYWGPSGMVFVRNPQVRYTTPLDKGGMKVAIALEAPNAAIDTGKVSLIDPSLDITGKTRWPDLTGSFTAAGDWGQFQAAGLLRSVGYQTTTTGNGEPSGTKVGWGINLDGWLKTAGKDRFTGQIVYGRGMASYMNDGGVDLAPGANLQAEVVPSIGYFLYYDHYWNDSFSSSLGYSAHRQQNTDGQFGNAFHQGSYASVNLLWYPAKNMLTGAELLWGKLEQKNGLSQDDARVQFSTQFKF